jgi:hypothetical protein
MAITTVAVTARKTIAVSCARRIFHPGIIVLVIVRVGQMLLIGSAVAAAVAPVSSDTIERVYSTTIYPKIQATVTPVSNAVSFALFDVITVIAVVALIVSAVLAVGRGSSRCAPRRRSRISSSSACGG